MKCPNCNNQMTNYLVKKMFNKMNYDICHNCGSLWLDRGELDKIAFQVPGSIEYCSKDKLDNQNYQKRECPKCDRIILEKVKFVGQDDIILDRCDNCGGFFLDGNELTLINKELEETGDVYSKGFSEFITDIHLPFWQKKINRKSTDTDIKNIVNPLKDSKVLSSTKFKCPRCKETLLLFKYAGIKYEGCPECRGIFLDHDELRLLKDKSENDSWGNLRWMDDEIEEIKESVLIPSPLNCPKCNSNKMISTIFGDSKIIIDYCTDCKGIWLDYKEYYDIIQYLKDKLDNFTSIEMKKKVRQEFLEIKNGPESIISEILDYKAAKKALIMITIYEHPDIAKRLLDFSSTILFKIIPK